MSSLTTLVSWFAMMRISEVPAGNKAQRLLSVNHSVRNSSSRKRGRYNIRKD